MGVIGPPTKLMLSEIHTPFINPILSLVSKDLKKLEGGLKADIW